MVNSESDNQNVVDECIRYLEFSVNDLDTKDGAIHNLLISLYIQKQSHKIIPYLTTSGNHAFDQVGDNCVNLYE